MKHTMQAIAICVALMATSLAAFAQDEATDKEGREGRGNPVRAAENALGLTSEQVDQIREIRRARPPRTRDREEIGEWREEQRTKVQGVLDESQKAKLAELEDARNSMRALAGASMLGLLETPWSGRQGARGDRGRNPGFRGRSPRRGGGSPFFRGRGFGQGRPGGFARGFRGGPRPFDRGGDGNRGRGYRRPGRD